MAFLAPASAATQQPAYAGDFPDPYVLMVGRATWAYATGSGPRNLQAMRSLDQSHWTPVSDPLPSLPAWARPGRTWAPSVLPRGLGFVMYYTVEDARSGRQCISAASAATPDGPFQDRSTSALVCQLDHGGSIDPAPFVAPDGTAYLLWKSEDNALGAAPSLWSQRLSGDGLALLGTRARLLTQAASWQAGVIEGPAMTVQNGRYYLFYGAGLWNTSSAAIGYATCTSPMGGCVNQSIAGPWLASSGRAVGPSSPAVFADGSLKLAYHAWTGAVGYNHGGVRSLWVGTLSFVGGRPVIS